VLPDGTDRPSIDAQVEPGYLLKNNDLLLHKCHRHEPPVSGEQPLPIVAEDERAVVRYTSTYTHNRDARGSHSMTQ